MADSQRPAQSKILPAIRCSRCGRTLTTAITRLAGIGATCAERDAQQ